MKKSLLVAALITGFAGVAQAETSVTLYGIVDGGIGHERVKGSIAGVEVDGKRTGFLNGFNSSNRWGLKGTEDLGNGLQAVFVLENGFNLGNGQASQDNRMFGRQATVGLKSAAWGQLDFGRQTNIATKYLAGVVSPFGTDFGLAQAGTNFSALASIRYDNMIMYQTPNFSGFQLGVGYSFNTSGNQQFKTSGGAEPNDRAVTAGLRYANGPLAAGLTYDEIKVRETALGFPFTGEEGTKIRSWNLGASYDFNVVKVHAGFGQTRNGWFGPFDSLDGSVDLDAGGFAPLDGVKINSYTLGLSAPVGANGAVMASWGMADPRNVDADKQQVFSLGYTYALSKRTNVYAGGSYARHVLFQEDLKATQVGVGLRHKF